MKPRSNALCASLFGLAAAFFPFSSNALSLTDEDIDALGRVAYAEAANQPAMGLKAVLDVILNRAQETGSVTAVVDAPHQFEPVLRAGGTWANLPQISERNQGYVAAWLECRADATCSDQSRGAIYFQNPRIVADRARKGKVPTSLVDFGGKPVTTEIGQHRFYGGRGAATVALPAVPVGEAPEIDRGPTRLVFGG